MFTKTRRMLQAEEILASQGVNLPLEEYISQELNSGRTFRTVAKTLQISQGALSYWCAKMGIQKRYTTEQGKVEQHRDAAA